MTDDGTGDGDAPETPRGDGPGDHPCGDASPTGGAVVRSVEPDGSIARAVVEAVADVRGVDPLTLDPPLFRAVDPDALEALYAHAARTDRPAPGAVAFELNECRVEVRFAGDVTVRPLRDPTADEDRR